MSEIEHVSSFDQIVDDYFVGDSFYESMESWPDLPAKTTDERLKKFAEVFWENLFAAFFVASTLPVFARRTAYDTGYMTMFGISLTAHMLEFDKPREERIRRTKEYIEKTIKETEWGGKLEEMSRSVARSYLWNYLEGEPGKRAVTQIMNQCAVLVWSSLEILASDVFQFLLNTKPQLASILLKGEVMKKHYREKELAGSLEEYEYNLSAHMGDALISQYRLDNLPAIKNVYGVLCKETDVLRKILSEKDLWKLYKVRNLVVHRAAVVDAKFQRDTGETIDIGTKYRVRPAELESYMDLTVKTAEALIESSQRILP